MSDAPAPASAAAPARYVELDGLRALAVGAVFLFHIVPGAPALFGRGPDLEWHWFGATIVPPTKVYDLVFHLNVGVQVFFVLSGFLITTMFVRPWILERDRPRLPSYAVRRAARIFPAYWIVLFVGGVTWFGLGEIDFPLRFGVWKHATLTYLYFPERWAGEFGGVDYGGLSVSWSLVAEATFYAFVPLWIALVDRIARRSGAARATVALRAALACIPLGVVGVLTFTYRTPWAAEVPFGGLITVFGAGLVSLGAGMVLAVLVAAAERTGDARLRRLGGRIGCWWGAAALGYVVLAWPEFPYLEASSAQQTWQRLVQPVVATLIVAPLVLAPGASTRVHRMLRSRPLVWIGTISYGIYLWHTVVIGRILEDHPVFEQDLWGASAIVAVAAVVTIVIAAASWYLVERPLLGWSRSWPRRTGRSRTSPTLAPS